jgi:hypothetical protein
MPTTPPSISALPAAPDPANRATFNTLAYPWSQALPTLSTQVSAVAANVKANADEAEADAIAADASRVAAAVQATNAANSAAAAAATVATTAIAWVSGTTYSVGDVRYSPINFASYRRRTSGAGTTDPSLDATNWALAAGGFGNGGTTITGNVTLTAASPSAMSVTPSAQGLYVTLPDATTVSRSTAPFSVYNNGDFDYGVKDSAGTQIGWIRARTGAVIGLADNTTAAGVWAYYGLEKTGITATYVNSTLSNASSALVRIALDANRTCFLFGSTNCYAIVYDASTQTWGGATLIRSPTGTGAFIGVLSATNQVLVCTNDATTGMQAVTLTISGTGITVNTPVSTTLSSSWASSYSHFIAVGSSFVVGYGRSGNVGAIRAITVSGTVPTIGAEASPAIGGASTAPPFFVSGSVVRVLTNNSAFMRCTPYTVSGSTLTVGTFADASANVNGVFRAFLNGNGNIVTHHTFTTHFAAIFKLTGTVEAASQINLGTLPTSVIDNADYVNVGANKTCFVYGVSGTSTLYANILTDTNGTASAGTELSFVNFSSLVETFSGLFAVGNTARFLFGGGEGAGSVSQRVGLISIDCSGSSPVAADFDAVFVSAQVPTTTPTATPQPRPSDRFGVRNATVLLNGANAVTLGGTARPFDLVASSKLRRPISLGVFQRAQHTWGSLMQGVVGGSSNQSVLFNAFGTNGIVMQIVESAA